MLCFILELNGLPRGMAYCTRLIEVSLGSLDMSDRSVCELAIVSLVCTRIMGYHGLTEL